LFALLLSITYGRILSHLRADYAQKTRQDLHNSTKNDHPQKRYLPTDCQAPTLVLSYIRFGLNPQSLEIRPHETSG